MYLNLVRGITEFLRKFFCFLILFSLEMKKVKKVKTIVYIWFKKNSGIYAVVLNYLITV